MKKITKVKNKSKKNRQKIQKVKKNLQKMTNIYLKIKKY